MKSTRPFQLLLVGVSLCLATSLAWSQACEVLGTGNHKVCASLGNICNPPQNGRCKTILIPKEDTQGGDCVCRTGPAPAINDSSFLLNPTGALPAANGSATVRWLPDGKRAAAIGMRGLSPFATYRVQARVGAVDNCSEGVPMPIGVLVVADGLGDAVVIEDTPALCPISVEEAGGLQRVVLCGVPPATSVPAASPWTQGALSLFLSTIAVLALRRRITKQAART